MTFQDATSGHGEDRIAHAWSQVEDYLDDLSPGPRERARLLRFDLGLASSPTGRIQDLTGEADDLPVLQNHLRLYDDIGGDFGPALLQALSRYVTFSLMLIHLHEGIRLPGSPFDRSWVGLADELARTTYTELALPDLEGTSWTDVHVQSWRRFHDALADETGTRTPEEVLAAGTHRFAPFLVAPVSVAAAAGRDDISLAVVELLDPLHAVVSLHNDLVRMRNDLLRGRVSPVVAWASQEMGLDPKMASAEEMAGAVIVSNAPRQLAELCESRLTQARCRSIDLRLEGFAALMSRMSSRLANVVRLFDLATRPDLVLLGGGATEPTSSPGRPELLKITIDAARRYLLADPSFRNSWEVHRWGLAGADEVTARFPAGLVLEILARWGNPVGPLIDEFAASVRERRLAYYDHPALPQVDTDTLGVLLRLHRWARDKPAHAQLVDEYLDLLEPHIDAGGEIPVWLDDGEKNILLGEGCGVIAAGVIIGLLAFDPEGRRDLIERSGRRVLERFTRRGPGISVNYPPVYALAVIGELARGIRMLGLLEDLWTPVEEALISWIDREAGAARPGAQGAALLVSACRRSGRRSVRPEWIDVLVECQHSDGHWSAEPFFFVPHRARSLTWYASDLMTSALCYDALTAYRGSE